MNPIQYNDLGTELPSHIRRSLDKSLGTCFKKYIKTIANYDHDAAAEAFSQLPQDLSKERGPDYSDEYITGAYLLHYQYNHCVMAYRTWKAVFDRIPRIPRKLFVADVGSGADASFVGLAIHLHLSEIGTEVNFMSVEPSKTMRRAGKLMRKSLKLSPRPCIKYRRYKGLKHRPRESLRFVTAFHLKMPYYPNRKNKALKKLRRALKTVSPDWFLATCHCNKADTLKQGLPKANPFTSAEAQFFPKSEHHPPGCRVFSKLGPKSGFDCGEELGPNCDFREGNRLNPPTGAVFLGGKWN